jgi:hypothetical protein
VDRLRWRWLEAEMAANDDHLPEAESLLLSVRQEWIDRGIGYDAALVSLDLAQLYARQGRTAEMKELASQMLPIFQAQDVHREALAALLLFREAAQAERAGLELLEQMRGYLDRARLHPDERFVPPAGAVPSG